MNVSKKLKKFQEGGVAPDPSMQDPAMAPQEGAPAGGEDPVAQIVAVAQQALQTEDCQAALGVCEALLSLLSQGGAGAEAPQGAPVYKKGGTLVKRVK